MKKLLKLMLGIGGCLFYYFLAFELADFGDPWDKMINWVKGNKNEELNYKKDSKQIKKVNKIERKYTSITNKDNEL